MGIKNIKMENVQVSLVGFSGEQVSTVGIINLTVYIKVVNLMVKYMVVDCHLTYNAILGKLWIYAIKAAPSTYHQVIRFPTKRNVREIQGDQKALREC